MKSTTVVLIATMLIACNTDQGPDPTTSTPDFGASYGIVAGANVTPKIEGTSLVLNVSYSGCTRDHTFSLHRRVRNGITEYWVYKETPDQDCEMAVNQQLTFMLPPDLSVLTKVVLIGPGETRFDLTKH